MGLQVGGQAVGGDGAGEEESGALPYLFAELFFHEGIVGAAEDQGVDVAGFEGAQILLEDGGSLGLVVPVLFDERDQKWAGLLMDL